MFTSADKVGKTYIVKADREYTQVAENRLEDGFAGIASDCGRRFDSSHDEEPVLHWGRSSAGARRDRDQETSRIVATMWLLVFHSCLLFLILASYYQNFNILTLSPFWG